MFITTCYLPQRHLKLNSFVTRSNVSLKKHQQKQKTNNQKAFGYPLRTKHFFVIVAAFNSLHDLVL